MLAILGNFERIHQQTAETGQKSCVSVYFVHILDHQSSIKFLTKKRIKFTSSISWAPEHIHSNLNRVIVMIYLTKSELKSVSFELSNSLNFLDRRISSGIPSSRVEDWQPLLNYRNSLMHGETDQAPVTSKRAYTKRRKEQDANEEDDEENENSDADPDFRG